jgi:hypothetical protein
VLFRSIVIQNRQKPITNQSRGRYCLHHMIGDIQTAMNDEAVLVSKQRIAKNPAFMTWMMTANYLHTLQRDLLK